MAPGMGAGMRGRGGHGATRWGSDSTYGWSLMTPQERSSHRTRMQSMTTYEECAAYREQHHEQMAARAQERGVTLPPQPRRDLCAGLKK